MTCPAYFGSFVKADGWDVRQALKQKNGTIQGFNTSFKLHVKNLGGEVLTPLSKDTSPRALMPDNNNYITDQPILNFLKQYVVDDKIIYDKTHGMINLGGINEKVTSLAHCIKGIVFQPKSKNERDKAYDWNTLGRLFKLSPEEVKKAYIDVNKADSLQINPRPSLTVKKS